VRDATFQIHFPAKQPRPRVPVMQPENDRVYLQSRSKAYEFKKMHQRRVDRHKSKETARFLGNAAVKDSGPICY
jgi:hypothetical protein